MSKEVASARIQHRGMSTQEWESSSDILMEREIGIDMTTGYPKVGDGKSRFSELNDLRGPMGPQGPTGERGPIGQTGPIGKTGDTGPQGPPGPAGEIGPKGDPGAKVVSGTVDSGQLTLRLDDGSQAVVEGDFRGPRGDKGEQGPPGPKGADGKMTFEQLTPEQREHLKGPKGDKGEPGKDGPPGIDGARGPSGPPGKDAVLPDDVVRKPDLTAYATKDELKKVSIGQAIPTFTTSYQYDNSYLRSYSEPGYRGTWSVNEDASKLIPGDIIALEVTNTSYYNKNYIIATVVSSTRSTITSLSRELAQDKPSDTTFLSQKEADKIYTTKKHKHEIDDINGLQATLNNKASAQHSHSEYLEQATADRLYLAKGTLPRDVVTSDTLAGYLAGYTRVADIKSQLDNIGKLKDTKTGQFLDVMVVDKGRVPSNTTGMIVFERALKWQLLQESIISQTADIIYVKIKIWGCIRQ